MTAAQMAERVRFYLNQQKSPRIDSVQHINPGLNVAQQKFIEDRVDNIKKSFPRGRKYFFEAVERVRSELYTIVHTATIVPINNIITVPADFYYELLLQLTVNGETTWSSSHQWGEIPAIERNSFLEPDAEYPMHIRSDAGIIISAGGGTITSSLFTYIKQPAIIDVVSIPNIDCELPEASHEEICEVASYLISGTYEDYRKTQLLKQQEEED